MKKKFIPIIGTISAGKSTFLQGLLGTNVFQIGSSTTTKFVCLIKNSNKTKFYHVNPKKDKNIEFIKEGEEIIGEENIRIKIEDINNNLSENPCKEDELFYMLEFPIKNIENISLLDECYFMDIPGLNENKNPYMDIIFKLLTLDDIKFEIIIFDSTNIGSDGILNVIKDLEKKNCLKKSGNLYILNKIDLASQNSEDDIKNNFMQYFYDNFEDDKKFDKNNDKFPFINIYENTVIKMNSLLYLNETKIEEDFSSMLLFKFYNFINYQNKNQSQLSLYEYLKNYLENNTNLLKEQNKLINLDVKSITKEDLEIIEKSIGKINKMKNKTNYSIEIKIKNKKEVKNNIIKLYLIHKNKSIFYQHSEYYEDLQNFIKKFNTDNNNLTNKSNNNQIKTPINQIDDNNNNKIDISSLNELQNFLNDTFKKINSNNSELENNFNISLNNLREYIIGRKIRIAFIGNISVGKSSVLNCIIGEDILPTNVKECTYRGIIIRHIENEEFKLYKTRLETKGKGSNEYYYFIDDKKPFCQGIDDIKSYLNVKNNDKEMDDKDCYLVITGNLKIFNFIKLDNDIISKIEFIDLPGMDRKNNKFIRNEYHKKILRFSNCIVYINEPKTVDDENSVNMMIKQYRDDKEKVFPLFRKDFIKTCLFLFNKIDTLDDDKEKIKLEKQIYNHISSVEKDITKENMNISFFSGKNFLNYLFIINDYIYLLENKPELLILKLYKKYNKIIYHKKSFKEYIFKEIENIEEKIFTNESEEENELEEENKIPENFYKKIKLGIEQIEKKIIKYKLFNCKDYDDIILKLYNLNKNLKNKDFNSTTNYSSKFFEDMKKVIENSIILNNENFRNNVIKFFEYADDLFGKEINEKEEEKIKEIEELETAKNNILEHISITKKNIEKVFNDGKSEILGIIDDEINNISERLKEYNNDIKKATEIIKNKINVVIQKMITKQKEYLSELIGEIEKEIKKKFDEKTMKISLTDIKTNKGLIPKMFASVLTPIFGAPILGGLLAQFAYTMGSSIMFSLAGGPISLAFGIGVGLTAGLSTLLVHMFSKGKKYERYEKGLKEFKEQIENNINESKNNFFDDFKILEVDFISGYEFNLELFLKDIKIDQKDWEELKKKYALKKDNLMKKLDLLKNKNN